MKTENGNNINECILNTEETTVSYMMSLYELINGTFQE